MLTRAVNNMSNMVALGYADLNADDVSPRTQPGQIGWFVDQSGVKYLRYIKNVRGSAFVLGDVVRRVADITVASITSGTTTSITKTAGFTANANVGKLVVYETASVAGAAPEGETGFITANTADVLSLDATYPLSATPVATSSIRVYAPWHGDITAGIVAARDVLGCVIGANGISNGQYGWVLFQGLHLLTKVTAAGIATGVAVVTGAGAVATLGASTADKQVGYNLATVAATNAGKYPIMWTLGSLGGLTNS